MVNPVHTRVCTLEGSDHPGEAQNDNKGSGFTFERASTMLWFLFPLVQDTVRQIKMASGPDHCGYCASLG